MPGSVFYHKKSGLWTLKVHVGNGKYQQQYFSSEEEADAHQARLASHPSHAANVGVWGSARLRLKEHIEEWLRRQEGRVRSGTLELKTLTEYRGHLSRLVIPDLGWMAVAKVSPRVLEEHYARLLERGLSPTTVRLVAAILRKIFQDAMKSEIVRQNPCSHVDPPAASAKRCECGI